LQLTRGGHHKRPTTTSRRWGNFRARRTIRSAGRLIAASLRCRCSAYVCIAESYGPSATVACYVSKLFLSTEAVSETSGIFVCLQTCKHTLRGQYRAKPKVFSISINHGQPELSVGQIRFSNAYGGHTQRVTRSGLKDFNPGCNHKIEFNGLAYELKALNPALTAHDLTLSRRYGW
jgi:hypothetical protein